MTKAGVILFADTESAEGMGRMANALTTAREFREAGDQVTVIFDGAGVKWIPALSDPEHKYHRAFERVRESVAGACAYCSTAYGVKDQVEASGVPLLSEFEGHPSVRNLITDGYHVITF